MQDFIQLCDSTVYWSMWKEHGTSPFTFPNIFIVPFSVRFLWKKYVTILIFFKEQNCDVQKILFTRFLKPLIFREITLHLPSAIMIWPCKKQYSKGSYKVRSYHWVMYENCGKFGNKNVTQQTENKITAHICNDTYSCTCKSLYISLHSPLQNNKVTWPNFPLFEERRSHNG